MLFPTSDTCLTFLSVRPCSLAIMTDAAHLLSDVSGFGVSLFAAWYAARKSHSTHTFGYHRVEVSALFQPETELTGFHTIRLLHCLPQCSTCALLLRIYHTPTC